MKVTVDNMTLQGTAEEIAHVLTELHFAQQATEDKTDDAVSSLINGMEEIEDLPIIHTIMGGRYYLLMDGEVVYTVSGGKNAAVAKVGHGDRISRVVGVDDVRREARYDEIDEAWAEYRRTR